MEENTLTKELKRWLPDYNVEIVADLVSKYKGRTEEKLRIEIAINQTKALLKTLSNIKISTPYTHDKLEESTRLLALLEHGFNNSEVNIIDKTKQILTTLETRLIKLNFTRSDQELMKDVLLYLPNAKYQRHEINEYLSLCLYGSTESFESAGKRFDRLPPLYKRQNEILITEELI